MRILALEPFYGGSHKAFLDGWIARSAHTWTLLTLPAYGWKWRMRHAGITFAEEVRLRVANGEVWEVVFCSDMLDLAGFKGLAPHEVGQLPALAYFHENQLTYPTRFAKERDYHFGMTNMTTGLAARRIWFNSAFHRDSFLAALDKLLRKMTDYRPAHALEQLRNKSEVKPQGIDSFPPRAERRPGPLRILWAARWEHDKNPETFFAALEQLSADGVDFRVSVIGEQFKESPNVFEEARLMLGHRVERWGFLPSRDEYINALREADVVVSTANHEFFGVSLVEAVAAGAFPLVPRRLAYPEILDADANPQFFYHGGSEGLAARLAGCADALAQGDLWRGHPGQAEALVRGYTWDHLAPRLDESLGALARP